VKESLKTGTDARATSAPGLRERLSALKAEWEARFTRDCFSNPLFLDAYALTLGGHDAFRVLGTLDRWIAGSSEQGAPAFRDRFDASLAKQKAQEAAPVGGVWVSLLDALDQVLRRLESSPGESRETPLQAAEELLRIGEGLLDEAALSGFRIDILNQFPSQLTPPFTAVIAPHELPELPEPPEAKVPIELESFVGKIFRGFKIVRILGRGGFGVVVLAEHPTLPLQRALKIFLDVDRSGPGFLKFRQRCFQESRLQATLKDPNIVEVLDAFEDQGYVVQVMEYVDGPNLGRLIEEKNRAGVHLPPEEVLDILIPVARGLAHAHQNGVVHRDLKPENILLDRARGGSPKIADFGLARNLEESGQRHHTAGHLVGTPLYMAPEQVASKAATYDHRCDLYSFGVVAYQLALGLPPFDHEDQFKILEMHEKEAPEALSLKLEKFPEELDRIILACLQKKPGDRFASAQDLLLALESCRRNLALGTTAVGTLPWERRRRTRVASVALAAGVLLLLALVTLPGAKILGTWMRPPAATGSGSEPRHAPKDSPDGGTPGGQKGEAILPTKVEGREQELPKEPAAAKKELPPAVALGRPLPKKPEPKSGDVPLRERIARYPLAAEEIAFTGKILDLFVEHRRECLARNYDGLAKDLEGLTPPPGREYGNLQLGAARELVGLAEDLVRGRWKELAESKGEVRLALADGRVALGTVNRADAGAITLAGVGGKTTIELSQVAPEVLLQDPSLPAAEAAFQALSGEVSKALAQAPALAGAREKAVLWYPLLARLQRLKVRELAKSVAGQAEAVLARTNSPADALSRLAERKLLKESLERLGAFESESTPLFPFLAAEFQDARREGEAIELLLSSRFSQVLLRFGGTEAHRVAATLLLARFSAELEEGSDDLIAKKGWINYEWQLRPDLPTREERLNFWDVLDGGGCVLRDPKGPRSLVMGRPHPRSAEGIRITFNFEPMGEDGAQAEWRIHLRREGGGNSFLRVDSSGVSLWPLTLDGPAPEGALGSAKTPRRAAEPGSHVCVLIRGEGLHVFLDGACIATFARQDAIIPAQPSFAVVHGALGVRSVQVKKKLSK
jgi:serine/threonine protein kinase